MMLLLYPLFLGWRLNCRSSYGFIFYFVDGVLPCMYL